MDALTSRRRRQLMAAALATPIATLPRWAHAQPAGWPDRPLKLVLGYPAGGAADGTARPISQKLTELLGQPLVFEYRPGAGATIAASYAAKSEPDGYTLHFTDSGPMTILPNGQTLDYDPLSDFTPIGMGCTGGTLIVAHPSLQAGNLQELIALAKRKPGGIDYGTSGIGGAGHLAAELLQSMTKTRLTHIPYKGGSQAISDLIGGQVPLVFSSMTTAIPHVQSGKIKAIGITSTQRAAALPDVPTVAEQGLDGFEASIWFAMVGPAGLARPIVERVNQAMKAALTDPALQAAIRSQGYEPMPGSPEDLGRQIQADYDKWGKVVREAGIRFG